MVTMAQHARWRVGAIALGLVLLATACAGGSVDGATGEGDDSGTAPAGEAVEAVEAVDATTDTTIEDYPDAQTRALQRLAAQPRPVPRSALPPRHLDAEQFPETLVERTLIVSGGVDPDAIAPIDEPWFEPVTDVDWLTDDEAVLVIELDDVARAYPIRVMILHEIVNDTVGGLPVAVTYCPLCNSGVAVERTVGGEVLDFGTSGALYQSALVMYDRQTESLWTHFDGRAVVGDYLGEQLALVPMATVAWDDFRRDHPDGEVLGRIDPNQPYGRNPYGAYDSGDGPLAGFFRGEIDDRLAAMERVTGVQVAGHETAVPLATASAEGVVPLDVDGERVLVVWTPGLRSALDGDQVSDGADIGATAVFRTELPLTIDDTGADGPVLLDADAGRRWSTLGTPIGHEGPALEPVPHVDTFWFAWSTYHPQTALAG